MWRPGSRSSDASLAASVGILLYMGTLRNSFVFDDHRAIEQNPCVWSGEGSSSLLEGAYWKRLLSTDFWGTPLDSPRSHHSYRPFAVLTLRLDVLLASALSQNHHQRPRPPSAQECACVTHAINAALHGATTWLLWWHAHHGLPGRSAPLLAALLFAAHPVNTEAVSYGVGRADLLSASFGLAGLLLHLVSSAAMTPPPLRGAGRQRRETSAQALAATCVYQPEGAR